MALAATAVGVCAMAGSGDTPIAAMITKPATVGARQRGLPGEPLAPKARISATVRVTSEAAKANHRHGALRRRAVFSRAATARYRHGPAELAPMVNGIRTDMVNERLIWGMRPVIPLRHPGRAIRTRCTGRDQTQPLSSRMASCQIISMPASLSLRQGMAAKFSPP